MTIRLVPFTLDHDPQPGSQVPVFSLFNGLYDVVGWVFHAPTSVQEDNYVIANTNRDLWYGLDYFVDFQGEVHVNEDCDDPWPGGDYRFDEICTLDEVARGSTFFFFAKVRAADLKATVAKIQHRGLL